MGRDKMIIFTIRPPTTARQVPIMMRRHFAGSRLRLIADGAASGEEERFWAPVGCFSMPATSLRPSLATASAALSFARHFTEVIFFCHRMGPRHTSARYLLLRSGRRENGISISA